MQRYIDVLFYISLTIIAGIGILLHSHHVDKYFLLTPYKAKADQEIIYKNHKQDLQGMLDDNQRIYNINAESIGDNIYLISFMINQGTLSQGIYGILFSTDNYNLVAYNATIWSKPKILASQDFLFSQTNQYIHSDAKPIIYRDKDNLVLLVNMQGKFKTISNKIQVFSMPLASIKNIFSNGDKESIKQTQFKLIKNLNFSGYGNITNFISGDILDIFHKPPTKDSTNKNNKQEFIMPLISGLGIKLPAFVIISSDLILQEKITIDSNISLKNPRITKTIDNDLQVIGMQNTSHSCLASYTDDSGNLYNQTCELYNGKLKMGRIEKSQNITEVNHIELATFGNLVLLLYTQNKSSSLNLAVWNGKDFSRIWQIENTKNKTSITSAKILINDDEGYIFYANNKSLHSITFNENYLASLITEEQ
ncbi:hypothetical protein LS73_008355 [Helicobacter muridarum]|uniref:Uncharacterized protein n=1 Tax=Helicobacter muridarum TaxID=216 RepID=A0A099TZN4_9HELI|nr:hypothetical protein [Helicobacter muridarum]TLD98780.1 hypothetical protein LS73_008355 [Helicobacter muridarum]STQ85453.1 Uncharacterised protein [Helicobacter muridarum]